jgi:Family of unknown function (DUF5764)
MEALVEARRQYLEALYECVIPEVVKTFVEMYDESDGGFRGKKTAFQKDLLEIKTWNSDVIGEHVETIKKCCPWLDGLIRASLVSLVQIMNSVRISKGGGKLSLTVPTTNDFIHAVYKQAATELYKRPSIMEEQDEDDRDDVLWEKCSKALDIVIRSSVPFQKILSMNITPSNEDEFTFENSDTEDPPDLPKEYDAPEEGENLFPDNE